MPKNKYYTLLDDSDVTVSLLDSADNSPSSSRHSADNRSSQSTESSTNSNSTQNVSICSDPVVIPASSVRHAIATRPDHTTVNMHTIRERTSWGFGRQTSTDYVSIMASSTYEENMKCIVSSALFVLLIGAIILVAILKNPQM